MNYFAKISLYLTSFFPLSIVYFLVLIEANLIFACSILAFFSFYLLVTSLLFRSLRKSSTEKIRIKTVELKNDSTTSYLISYVLPFTTIPIDSSWNQILAFFVFFVVLGHLYINSNMIFINPFLNLVGLNIYKITNNHGKSYMMLTNQSLSDGDITDGVALGSKMYYYDKHK